MACTDFRIFLPLSFHPSGVWSQNARWEQVCGLLLLAVLMPGPPETMPGSLWEETCQVDLRFLHAWFVCGLDFNFFLHFNFGGFVLFSEKALDSCINHANPAMCNVFYQWKNRNWMASSCEQTQCKAWAWKIISTFPKPTRHAGLVNGKAVHLG